jgi:hypothetical protein
VEPDFARRLDFRRRPVVRDSWRLCRTSREATRIGVRGPNRTRRRPRPRLEGVFLRAGRNGSKSFLGMEFFGLRVGL